MRRKWPNKGVDAGVPGLVGGRVGELPWARNVAAGVDVGMQGLQVVVGLDRAALRERDTQLLEPEAGGSRLAPDRDQDDIKGHLLGAAVVREAHAALASPDRGTDRLVTRQHANSLLLEPFTHQGGDVVVLALEQTVQLLCHRDRGPEPGERLRQLAGDRPTAEDQQPLGHRLQPP